MRYSNYCFDNNKNVRFFASNIDEAKELCDYLNNELSYRIQVSEGKEFHPTPHYLIICENYNATKKLNFFKSLMEVNANIGYSTIIVDKSLNNLPSKCSNFILNKIITE